jgi:hypothetical protein
MKKLKRSLLAVGVGAVGFSAIPANIAQASEPIEIGPCSDPDAIVVRVGQYATVCVYAIDTNECDANDIYVQVGSRTFCIRVP